uniref:C3H1-type domain-containing protein n=1 Tax=Chromera velia CCMP2878 TaxID=1169474 RepID=A0A0G4FHF0_9ALVE|eukprot:Cvel_3303.t1-p1 / transcript=Cvel_3303.t1 / gene=Cvel_3303 / organism=Chromera_velia_CCMP2878 / gene_product=Zinc finger CCCH domain-containing protein 39, putative / transcript_product=Zinc finger CCCH domain-containing protein 39, putative / location=Cvel_scaffold131:9857-15531(-) / protein_length=515 / sequence_SO=supercontig / SO=protein_coding / is_pseudo=false
MSEGDDDRPTDQLNFQWREALYKTQLCKHFSTGYCPMEDSCRFAHGVDDLRRRPALERTSLCYSVLRGFACARGNDCTYAHTFEELNSARVLATDPRVDPSGRGARGGNGEGGERGRAPPPPPPPPENANVEGAAAPILPQHAVTQAAQNRDKFGVRSGGGTPGGGGGGGGRGPPGGFDCRLPGGPPRDRDEWRYDNRSFPPPRGQAGGRRGTALPEASAAAASHDPRGGFGGDRDPRLEGREREIPPRLRPGSGGGGRGMDRDGRGPGPGGMYRGGPGGGGGPFPSSFDGSPEPYPNYPPEFTGRRNPPPRDYPDYGQRDDDYYYPHPYPPPRDWRDRDRDRERDGPPPMRDRDRERGWGPGPSRGPWSDHPDYPPPIHPDDWWDWRGPPPGGRGPPGGAASGGPEDYRRRRDYPPRGGDRDYYPDGPGGDRDRMYGGGWGYPAGYGYGGAGGDFPPSRGYEGGARTSSHPGGGRGTGSLTGGGVEEAPPAYEEAPGGGGGAGEAAGGEEPPPY